MNYVRRISVLLAAASACGCGGTIDDYGPFEETGRSNALQGPLAPGNGRPDAGNWPEPRAADTQTAPAPGPDAGQVDPSGDEDMIAPPEGQDAAGNVLDDMAVACDFGTLVEEKCGAASCHGAPALTTGLDLTSPELPARLETRAGPGPCADLSMIDHADPESSALYLKVSSEACGTQMPPGGALTPDEQACFLTWIEGLSAPIGDTPVDDDPVVPDEQTAGVDDLGEDDISEGRDEDEGPTSSCDFPALVEMRCGGSSCHAAPAQFTGLDLTSPGLASRVAGREGPAACGDTLLIDEDTPDQSALYLKVSGTSCGTQMPPGGMLSPDEQDCFLSWIEGL